MRVRFPVVSEENRLRSVFFLSLSLCHHMIEDICQFMFEAVLVHCGSWGLALPNVTSSNNIVPMRKWSIGLETQFAKAPLLLSGTSTPSSLVLSLETGRTARRANLCKCLLDAKHSQVIVL